MCNKKSLFGGDAHEKDKLQETESANLESDDSDLEYNDPDYNNYEDVVNENNLEQEPMEAIEQVQEDPQTEDEQAALADQTNEVLKNPQKKRRSRILLV